MKKYAILILLWCFSFVAQADAVYEKQSKATFELVYSAVYKSLESSNFYVVHELNICKSMARFGKKWGDDYNRSKLTEFKSMIVCNGWYANKVSNKDPKMLALCPLRVNLIQREGVTSVLFELPTAAAQGSPALPVLQEVEEAIIKAINSGVAAAK